MYYELVGCDRFFHPEISYTHQPLIKTDAYQLPFETSLWSLYFCGVKKAQGTKRINFFSKLKRNDFVFSQKR